MANEEASGGVLKETSPSQMELKSNKSFFSLIVTKETEANSCLTGIKPSEVHITIILLSGLS